MRRMEREEWAHPPHEVGEGHGARNSGNTENTRSSTPLAHGMASHRDPRVPGLTFKRNVLKEEELPMDGYAILSILFGFLGVASKVRLQRSAGGRAGTLLSARGEDAAY